MPDRDLGQALDPAIAGLQVLGGAAGHERADGRLAAKVALQRLLQIAPNFRLRVIDLGPAFFTRGPESGFLEVAVRA